MNAMRIGIDAHMVGARETGNETYIVNLLRELLAVDGEDRYLPLTPFPRAVEAVFGPAARDRVIRVQPAPSLLRVSLGIPLAAYRHSLDLLHMTYFTPPVCQTPVVVTVHDISFEVYPKTFSTRDRLLLSWGVPFAVRRATRIIAVSEYTKQDLICKYGIPGEKIDVTYEAAAPQFRPVEDPGCPGALCHKYGLSLPYILGVGNLQPRKNLRALLEAFRFAKTERRIPHRLVLVGKPGWEAATFLQEVRTQGLEKEVIFTGYVPTEDLPGLYSSADLFVYPALYEGFGLPPLEAMACGTPVVASDAASLPEVLGEAALLVNARDIGALASAILRVLDDSGLALRLSGLGLAQARRFSWERTARKTVEVYRKALEVSQGTVGGRRISSWS